MRGQKIWEVENKRRGGWGQPDKVIKMMEIWRREERGGGTQLKRKERDIVESFSSLLSVCDQ